MKEQLRNFKRKFGKLVDHYITEKYSNRAFYGHGNKFKDNTEFQVGSKYVVDVKNQKILILSHDEHQETDLKLKTVSKRDVEGELLPVIDVKDKKSIQAFEGVEYLEIKIYEDGIVVEGYVEEKEHTSINSMNASKKVTSITDFMKVRKVASATMSHEQLRMVSGGHYQTSIFDVETITREGEVVESSVSSAISNALKNTGIALTAATFFCGAGMLDYAFKEAGFDILLALDRNAGDEKGCLDTYRYNIGNHAVEADIKKYDFSKLPKVSVCIAGVDCKAFSNANRHSRLLDHPNNDLFRYYLKAIKATEADIFLIENVPGFLSAFNGQIGEEIREEMEGFEITAGILNSRDFGSAQDRRRAILIGSRIGRIELPFHTIKEPKTVGQAFEGLHNGIPNQMDFSQPKPETLERMKHIPQGGNWRNLPEHLRTSKMGENTQDNIYRRLDPNSYSCTMVNVRKCNITHPTENRSLSVRESARLQDLPDTFVFKGPTLNSKQSQVANGVPFSLGKALAVQIKRHIERVNKKAKDVVTTFREGANGQLALF